jgi:hypothetical protein
MQDKPLFDPSQIIVANLYKGIAGERVTLIPVALSRFRNPSNALAMRYTHGSYALTRI